ncbi:MAG: DUF99 family protein [Candidatus Heimdallarchaeota archaeon]|nr:DUF99 family protein [Candidatus Heimdallarchaeota archaeon]MBY8995615.1 DUF99 family protein [Candidatus Heimdallarchaeota archaeon]
MNKQLKKGIKIIGLACASFNREKDEKVSIIGAIYRGSLLLEGVLKNQITVDGNDATDRIVDMIQQSTHQHQLKLIMTRGVTIAGFNCIDLEQIHKRTGLPIISVVDREPNMEKITKALQNLPDGEKKLAILKKNGLPRPYISTVDNEPIYVQFKGIKHEEVSQLLKDITLVGRTPEPIRVARIIAIAE